MADLTPIEKRRLEEVLRMQGGYVLDFSDNSFQEFVCDTTGIDVYKPGKYDDVGTSKAKRLRSFWKKEPNLVVGNLIAALVELWKMQHIDNDTFDEKTCDWYTECLQIVERLRQDSKDEITIEAHFEKIQSQIIEKLESAQFTIWVAVAWFTDQKLFNHLLAKKKQGVNVQLVIADDEINEQYGFDYENAFETYRIKNFGKYKNNIVHNKFCVIDLQTVIEGSYNWTDRARFNSENISIIQNRELAEKFAHQFIKLKISNESKSLQES